MRITPIFRLVSLAAPLLFGPALGLGQAQTTRQCGTLARLYARGSYDQAIEQAGDWIEAAQQKPASLERGVYYWRGVAEYQIGWYAQAKADFNLSLQPAAPLEPDNKRWSQPGRSQPGRSQPGRDKP